MNDSMKTGSLSWKREHPESCLWRTEMLGHQGENIQFLLYLSQFDEGFFRITINNQEERFGPCNRDTGQAWQQMTLYCERFLAEWLSAHPGSAGAEETADSKMAQLVRLYPALMKFLQ